MLTHLITDNMDLRIKLKAIDDENVPKQADIADLAAKAFPRIEIVDMYKIPEGAILKVSSKDAIYALLESKAQDVLKTGNIKAIPPAWLSPSRILFVSRVPWAFLDRSNKEILKEINEKNASIELEEALIIASKGNSRRKLLKLIFKTEEKADEILKKGFTMFNYVATSDNIVKHKLADNISVDQCYKCFKFTHTSNRCPNKDYLCSICGQQHHYSKCTNKNKPKCLNCNSNEHHAASNDCPEKRKLMKMKKAQHNIYNNNNTDVNNSENNQQSTNAWTNQQYPPLNNASKKDADAIIQAEVISNFAIMLSNGDPLQFWDISSSIMKENNIPLLRLPRGLVKRIQNSQRRVHEMENRIDEEYERIRRQSEENERMRKAMAEAENYRKTKDQNKHELSKISEEDLMEGADNNTQFLGTPPPQSSLPPELPEGVNKHYVFQSKGQRKLKEANSEGYPRNGRDPRINRNRDEEYEWNKDNTMETTLTSKGLTEESVNLYISDDYSLTQNQDKKNEEEEDEETKTENDHSDCTTDGSVEIESEEETSKETNEEEVERTEQEKRNKSSKSMDNYSKNEVIKTQYKSREIESDNESQSTTRSTRNSSKNQKEGARAKEYFLKDNKKESKEQRKENTKRHSRRH